MGGDRDISLDRKPKAGEYLPFGGVEREIAQYEQFLDGALKTLTMDQTLAELDKVLISLISSPGSKTDILQFLRALREIDPALVPDSLDLSNSELQLGEDDIKLIVSLLGRYARLDPAKLKKLGDLLREFIKQQLLKGEREKLLGRSSPAKISDLSGDQFQPGLERPAQYIPPRISALFDSSGEAPKDEWWKREAEILREVGRAIRAERDSEEMLETLDQEAEDAFELRVVEDLQTRYPELETGPEGDHLRQTALRKPLSAREVERLEGLIRKRRRLGKV